jgi:hypothetical protein
MEKFLNSRVKFAATLFCLVQSGVAAAEEEWINGGIGASQIWDGNFFRNPEEISEQIRLLSAGIGLSANVSRQKFSARWRVRSYQHVNNEQLDETFQDGAARWNGAWAGDFTTNVEWVRDSYLVDRWEAAESDVVAKDDAKFSITRGAQNRFSFKVGARDTNQKHSSELREEFNYHEKEAFAGVTYKTPSYSTLSLFYRAGDRTYVDRLVEDPESNFDFDYRQVDLENVWKISDKTTSTITISRFSRKGVLNDSVGDYALLDLSWDATPKIQWHAGYSYKRPALGETIDLPSTVQTGFISASWDVTSKLELTSRFERLLRDYNRPDELFVRTESQYNIIPLALTYQFSEAVTVKLDSSWRKNESPIPVRQYKSAQVVLGLAVRF